MVTKEGYVRRTYEEILKAKIEKAKELFGADINTESNTPLGKYIRINAYDQYNVEAAAEKIYYSIFPQTASGQSLDRLGWTIGIERKAATHSVYNVVVTGTDGEYVEAGFKVGTESGLEFTNLYRTPITLNEEIGSFVAVLTVQCDEAGTIGNVDAKDIVKIINPVAYVHEIFTNTDGEGNKKTCDAQKCVTAAEDDENDYDFLKRYEIARNGRGSCNEAAIRAALLNIHSVNDVYIKITESEAVGEIPAHTIACYVVGGEGEGPHKEIAEAIFDKKAAGIGTWGSITVPVEYGALSGDYTYDVKFSHAQQVGVHISLELTTDNTFDSTNGKNEIKKNIESFIRELGIGKPLVLTALYQAIYSVKGVTSAVLTASKTDGNYTSLNIEVSPYQYLFLSKLYINAAEV